MAKILSVCIQKSTLLLTALMRGASTSQARQPQSNEHKDKKMNVVFIVCDDLNADLGSFDDSIVKTPNLDRIRAHAVRFNNAYCQYPLSGPTRASFLTGYSPERTKVMDLKTNFRTAMPDGTLLNDEWCRFFKENNFLVGVSVDGPQEFHDEYRRTSTGKPTFRSVMKGIDLLNKYGVEWNALAVVNDFNADYPLDFYHFFKSIGCHYIQFTPIVERIIGRADGLTLAPSMQEGGELTDFSVTLLIELSELRIFKVGR